jgi:hypothetical protein
MFFMGFFFLLFSSFSKVLRWVADPVEPFRFKFVQHELPLPFPGGIQDIPGKEPHLPEQLHEGRPDRFHFFASVKWLSSRR